MSSPNLGDALFLRIEVPVSKTACKYHIIDQSLDHECVVTARNALLLTVSASKRCYLCTVRIKAISHRANDLRWREIIADGDPRLQERSINKAVKCGYDIGQSFEKLVVLSNARHKSDLGALFVELFLHYRLSQMRLTKHNDCNELQHCVPTSCAALRSLDNHKRGPYKKGCM